MLRSVIVLICLLFTITAQANTKIPMRVAQYEYRTAGKYNSPIHRDLEFIASVDKITIKRIVVNRGQCASKAFKPTTLTYGQSARFFICDRPILDVAVYTDKGNFTWSW